MYNHFAVVDIERENNVEVLRQVARLQERENERLRRRVAEMAAMLAKMSGDPTVLQRELVKLQELLARREQALFGRSSESQPKPNAAPATREKQRGHGPTQQPLLTTVERTHTLDAADMKCPACGADLDVWKDQFEESEEIDVVETQYVLTKHKRQKYRCRCGGCVETALGPKKLRPGNRYSIEFAISVALAKYLDHLPLERQVRMMRRQGLNVTSQVLWDQLELLAGVVGKAVERLLVEHVLKAPCVGMDETHWLLLNDKEKTEENRRWWVWSVCSTDAVVHRIFDTRSHVAAKELLGDYAGVLLTDGYAAYAKARKEGGHFRQSHCWSHVRREFLAAEKFYPREAAAVVKLIDEIFLIEREVPTTGPPEERLELRRRLRDERTRWVVKALECWGLELGRSTLPESALGKAAAYMAELWPGLVRFVDDPNVPVDNNATERALRGVVLGRKNHYGSKSRRGTEVAAVFYSIVESCKLCDVDPRVYLRRVVDAALADEPLPLPHELAAAAA